MRNPGRPLALGLRENLAQFSLLIAVNVFVGAMVGLERTTLPLIGQEEFGLSSSTAVLSFITAFGIAKAVTNLGTGALAQRVGRRRLLVVGWLVAIPIPLMIGLAPSWGFVVAANVLLGINQGMTWSMTVVMKIDLVGPQRRGLALGINESAGYSGVAVAAAATGWLAGEFAALDIVVWGAVTITILALLISLLFVRDTADHVALDQSTNSSSLSSSPTRLSESFRRGTYRDRALRSCSQAGLVNNLNDALAWGLVPLFLASHGASVAEIGGVAATYPAVWSITQIWAGNLSDRVGRKPLIVTGMLVQALALGLLALSNGDLEAVFALAALLGIGTALVYPTLLAAVSDHTQPRERPAIIGVYRYWRDSGYVIGGLGAGIAADSLGYGGAIGVVAALTAASGLWAAFDMPESESADSSDRGHARPANA